MKNYTPIIIISTAFAINQDIPYSSTGVCQTRKCQFFRRNWNDRSRTCEKFIQKEPRTTMTCQALPNSLSKYTFKPWAYSAGDAFVPLLRSKRRVSFVTLTFITCCISAASSSTSEPSENLFDSIWIALWRRTRLREYWIVNKNGKNLVKLW